MIPTETQQVYAQALRDLGWTVIPPAAPGDAIPKPEVGQTWVSPNPRVKERVITGLLEERWREWARKTGARPVVP